MNEHIKEKTDKYPRTRFMGSKQKLLDFIYDNVKGLEAESVLDAFSGSGCVGYLFKTMGKQVHTNDMLKSCYITSKATIENKREKLSQQDIDLVINNKTNRKIIMDVIYTPLETALIRNAKEKKYVTITGDRMLLFQGIKHHF